ncbi:MAG: HDIG domain-containing protein [Trueperaceae bacterium]|nr:HDIG domain-containing protein [Trueperaceae bacterium]
MTGWLTALLRRARAPARLAPWPRLEAFGPRPDGGVLVGGALRDALLGLSPLDTDWIVPDPRRAARELAARTGGHAFALDATRGHWRVHAGARTLDVVAPQGTLEADLRQRDFTMNAMALRDDGPVDPLDGRRDLARRTLRATSPRALRADPLRGLRGVRLAATHALSWDSATRRSAASVAAELAEGALPLPAAERRRDELALILASVRAGDALAEAHALGWLALLLPELITGDGVAQGGFHHLDVLRHQLEALQRLVTAFPEADRALRLGTVLHDVGKPACRDRGPDGRLRFYGHAGEGAAIARRALTRLRFDGATVQRAAALVHRHMLPLPRNDVEARRFVHRRRELLPDLMKLMIADREAARGRLSSEGTRRAYRLALARIVAILEEAPPPEPLLRGEDVMACLGLAPGPRVGEALAFLHEAQAVGDVTTPEEARAALRRFAAAQNWDEVEA